MKFEDLDIKYKQQFEGLRFTSRLPGKTVDIIELANLLIKIFDGFDMVNRVCQPTSHSNTECFSIRSCGKVKNTVYKEENDITPIELEAITGLPWGNPVRLTIMPFVDRVYSPEFEKKVRMTTISYGFDDCGFNRHNGTFYIWKKVRTTEEMIEYIEKSIEFVHLDFIREYIVN